jgi:integrase
MKAKKPHVIPLSPPALAILAARRRGGDGLVFSSGRRGFGSWVHCKAVLDARVAEARKAAGLAEPMPAWVQHDFRRVFSTVAHETLGVPPHIVEACLAHAGQGRIAGTYNRALYLDERRRALERWADYVDAAVTGRRRSSEVVNLRKR